MRTTIEICASSMGVAKAAYKIGADRIEICHDLSVGGVTPSYETLEVCSQLDIPTRVLIRPRSGDFVYSEKEVEQMLSDIQECKELDLEGIVIGALLNDGTLDIPALKKFRHASSGLKLIFHRGIDHCEDEGKFERIIDLGFDGILSSGSIENVRLGMDALQRSQDKYGDDLEIVAGGGVSATNVNDLLQIGIPSIHFSCQKLGTETSLSFNEYANESSGNKHIFDMEKWQLISNLIRSLEA
ncbi:MAG: copper homeostasis protein CutC [Flavobacteriales bacterium]|nr:copper homeostasis protein CutC [Flavobacteriales bacterium]